MSRLSNFAYALAVIDMLLEELKDEEKFWFRDRGVTEWDLDNLRLSARSVGRAFNMNLQIDRPKEKPHG